MSPQRGNGEKTNGSCVLRCADNAGSYLAIATVRPTAQLRCGTARNLNGLAW